MKFSASPVIPMASDHIRTPGPNCSRVGTRDTCFTLALVPMFDPDAGDLGVVGGALAVLGGERVVVLELVAGSPRHGGSLAQLLVEVLSVSTLV